ncbi:MAG: 2-oxoacid:acceptor oxidoreductase subunit alpha, partial [bacterium]|nr:2-oxoacid:acceptor oxidoreductase subunit alpha [bacterium]
LEDGYIIMQKAFNLADKYQVPVFVLTDQYYMDSYYNLSRNKIENLKIEKHIIKTQESYKRFSLTNTGISPRGVPGFGSGLVCVDSDEHDEEGRITEDHDLRIKMVDKRLKKMELIKNEVDGPVLFGPGDYDNIIVCWGSTVNSILETLEKINHSRTSVLYFRQVFPLPRNINKYLESAKKRIIIEGNAASQFGRLIESETECKFDERILKYNGLQFSVEELTEKITKIL